MCSAGRLPWRIRCDPRHRPTANPVRSQVPHSRDGGSICAHAPIGGSFASMSSMGFACAARLERGLTWETQPHEGTSKRCQMSSTYDGEQAVKFISTSVPCPSCAGPLMELPRSYPIFDVQCSKCLFQAQVKRVAAGPRHRIRGASWGPIDVLVRTGLLLPPIFICFGWPISAKRPARYGSCRLYLTGT